MATRDYFPGSDPDLLIFSNNFPGQLAAYANQLGISAEKLALITTAGENTRQFIRAADLAHSAAKAATAAKKANIETYKTLMRAIIREIKANPNFTANMGEGLGIWAPETSFDPATYHSKLRATVHLGYVTIKFLKKGVDGINLYARLRGEPGWTRLGFYSHSPCEDKRPLSVPGTPEVRQYMCIGVKRDQEVGQPSTIAEVTFGGGKES